MPGECTGPRSIGSYVKHVVGQDSRLAAVNILAICPRSDRMALILPLDLQSDMHRTTRRGTYCEFTRRHSDEHPSDDEAKHVHSIDQEQAEGRRSASMAPYHIDFAPDCDEIFIG